MDGRGACTCPMCRQQAGASSRHPVGVAIQQASACYCWLRGSCGSLFRVAAVRCVVAWLRAVPDEPGLPSAEELAALPHGVLAERLAEAYRLIAQLTARVERWSGGPGRIPPRHRSRRRRTARSGRSRRTGRCGRRGSGRPGSSPASPARRCGWWTTRTSAVLVPARASAAAAGRAWRRAGLRAAPSPGHRHCARAGAGGHRARGAGEGAARAAGRSPRASCPRTCGRGPASGRRRTRRPRT